MQCASSTTNKPICPAISGKTCWKSARYSGVQAKSAGDRIDRGQGFFGRFPFLLVGAVDRDRPDADPLGHLDLVAHQREQRADQQGGAGALLAQQLGCQEIDHAFPHPVRCTTSARWRRTARFRSPPIVLRGIGCQGQA